MNIRENVKISELVTMKIGGIAKYVIEITSKDDINELVQFLKEKEIKNYYILGRGANTFATDELYNGAIILNKIQGITIEKADDQILFTVGSGVDWDDFIDKTIENGCTGVECLAGIPGTVGAAPVQNIGAYGQEVKNVISKIKAYDFIDNKYVEFSADECDFGYRHSIFNSASRGRFLIYEVDFVLKKGELEGELYNSLQSYLNENNIEKRDPKTLSIAVRAVRDLKLPDPNEIASSGSFFKNVYVNEDEIEELDKKGIPHHGTKVNTGWLIENSGIKGENFHGFKVSDKAALVLINESGKTYEDLVKAVSEISDIVYEKFGFRIEQEPNVIGENND